MSELVPIHCSGGRGHRSPSAENKMCNASDFNQNQEVNEQLLFFAKFRSFTPCLVENHSS